mgnify:FL=1
MNNITKKFTDARLKQTLDHFLCDITYVPINLNSVTFTIKSTRVDSLIPTEHSENQPAEKQGYINVYSVESEEWLSLDTKYVSSVLPIKFNDHCAQKEIKSESTTVFSSHGEMVIIPELTITSSSVSPVEWIHNKSTDFNYEEYIVDVVDYIKSFSTVDNIWEHSINYQNELKLTDLLAKIDVSVYDLILKSDVCMSDIRSKWIDVIEEYSSEARAMLLKDIDAEEEIDQAVRDEVDVILGLLDNISEEAKPVLDSCQTVSEIMQVWPPLLLPAPDYVNVLLEEALPVDYDILDPQIIK